MSTPEARRSPRVAYHAAVELIARSDDDGDGPRTLSAATLDLGAGGMRVAVAERVAIGSPLTCRLTLDGRSTALSGRVVWMRAHTSPTPHGMGIRFDELAGYEQRLLADVVERSSAGNLRVQLQFDGTSSRIVARARPHATGFTLSAPLPILDRGAGVEVRLDPETPALRGRVEEVRVVDVDARRRLEVEIALGEPDGARDRREARFASARDLPAVSPLSDTDTDTDMEPRPSSVVEPARVASGTGRMLLSLLVGVAAGLALATRLPSATPTPPTATPAPATPPPQHASPAPPLQATPEPDAQRTPPTAGAQASPATPPTPTVPAAITEPATPSVSSDDTATVLRLPFSGTLEGMVARTWAQPAALALDLPGGRVLLGPGSHELRGGSITGLRVNARGGASLLRVHLAQPITRYAVTAHDGVLELSVFAVP